MLLGQITCPCLLQRLSLRNSSMSQSSPPCGERVRFSTLVNGSKMALWTGSGVWICHLEPSQVLKITCTSPANLRSYVWLSGTPGGCFRSFKLKAFYQHFLDMHTPVCVQSLLKHRTNCTYAHCQESQTSTCSSMHQIWLARTWDSWVRPIFRVNGRNQNLIISVMMTIIALEHQ